MRTYQIQRRSLNRWRANSTLGFPQPTEINGRCYYKVSDLDAFDRRVLMASLAKAVSD